MVERPIGDSAQDFGVTDQFASTVGTSSTALPASPGNPIATVLIRCPQQTPNTVTLSYSFDNVTFHVLSVGEFIGWSLKGDKTQIYLKGSVAGVKYEVTMNREPT